MLRRPPPTTQRTKPSIFGRLRCASASHAPSNSGSSCSMPGLRRTAESRVGRYASPREYGRYVPQVETSKHRDELSERAKSIRRRAMFMPGDGEELDDRSATQTPVVPSKTWTRRDWIKAGAMAGAAAGVGTLVGAEVLAPLLAPPIQPPGTIR